MAAAFETGAVGTPGEPPVPAGTAPTADAPGGAAGPGARVSGVKPPEGAVDFTHARALEELFVGRFDEAMAEIQRVPHPVEQQLYPASERERIHVRRSRSDEVVDIMKRHRVYERDLLDALPLDEISEYRVFTKSFFGKRDTKVVVAAACVSPLEDFVLRRCSLAKAGARDLERAIEGLNPRPETFHYVGLLATCGWEKGVERHVPARPNLLVVLVESRGHGEWAVRTTGDQRWGGLTRIYDPETDQEKRDRAKRLLRSHKELSLRGGHVLLQRLHEDLRVSAETLDEAVQELLREDADLSIQDVAGRKILKRKRL